MKRQLSSTSQVEEPQRNVRSCIFRDPFEEPRGFPPRVQSMSPHLHVPHQSPTPAPGGGISGLSVGPHSLQPLPQSTVLHVGAHHQSLSLSLGEISVSVSSTVPAVISSPLVQFMNPTGSQPSVRSMAPHLSGHLQSRTLAPDGSSLSMSSEAPSAAFHSSARHTVPQLSQQHQNHMSALGDRGASLFSTTPAGYQPFAQSTAQCLSVYRRNRHPVLRCMAPHLRAHFGSQASASCERRGEVSSMDTTRELAQSRVETEPMRDPIQSTHARQVRIARRISSLQATHPPAPFSVGSTRNPVSVSGVETEPMRDPIQSTQARQISSLQARQVQIARQIFSLQVPLPPATISVSSTRNPVSVSGSQWDDRPDSSAPRQNFVGRTSNHVRNQNFRIMPANRHSGMRMNIDNMDYEELLALGGRIGKVNTGVKTYELSKYVKKVICCGEQDEAEQCVICLAQYGDGDELGKLHCSHEYHYTCLAKWMKEKAICPICRRTPARF